MGFVNLTELAGIILICAGIFSYLNAKNFIKKAFITDGTVTGYEEELNIECPVYAHLIVKFTTRDGKEISFKDKNGVYSRSYREGDTISVAYMQENPKRALINSKTNLWKESAYILVLGIILVLVSFI